MRALISVSDKTGIVELAKELTGLGVEIISTGGTYRKLTEAGIKAIEVSELTGFPECLDGRVKTLHPVVHAGLLAMRSNPEHMRQLEELHIEPIDMVIVNLYPFKATIMKDGVTREDAVENIDIGRPHHAAGGGEELSGCGRCGGSCRLRDCAGGAQGVRKRVPGHEILSDAEGVHAHLQL